MKNPKKSSPVKSPEEWAEIAESVNANMANFTSQLRGYVVLYAVKLALVAGCDYSNEEANQKIQEMIENSQNL